MGERLTTCGRRSARDCPALRAGSADAVEIPQGSDVCSAPSVLLRLAFEKEFFSFAVEDDRVFAATRLQQVGGTLRCVDDF
ncbi:hypothetical protein CEXT_619571 [Caerostris extrusa]|uniref:Uncharacterized protein n=1 Tax=Caerostris extrusa TaxID=172846 RepID=A0AAV4XE35_CAEEX|nr:hypothetical protein CEXT_619571 [Caerostris extrusa]